MDNLKKKLKGKELKLDKETLILEKFKMVDGEDQKDTPLKDRTLNKKMVQEYNISFQDIHTMAQHYRNQLSNIAKESARLENEEKNLQKQLSKWQDEIVDAVIDVPELVSDLESKTLTDEQLARLAEARSQTVEELKKDMGEETGADKKPAKKSDSGNSE